MFLIRELRGPMNQKKVILNKKISVEYNPPTAPIISATLFVDGLKGKSKRGFGVRNEKSKTYFFFDEDGYISLVEEDNWQTHFGDVQEVALVDQNSLNDLLDAISPHISSVQDVGNKAREVLRSAKELRM